MPAPKGNLYALGNKGGKPPIYKTAEELQLQINAYFESLVPEPIKRIVEDEDGEEKEIEEQGFPTPPTITGLALFLGFCDKKSLYDYRKKEEFGYLIKRALMVVENHYEMTLNYKSPTGAIFALKNMDWHDKSEVEVTNINPLNIADDVE